MVLFKVVIKIKRLLLLVRFSFIFSTLLPVSLKSKKKYSSFWPSLIIILMQLVRSKTFIILIFNLYVSCLCQSFIYRFLLRRYVG